MARRVQSLQVETEYPFGNTSIILSDDGSCLPNKSPYEVI